MRAAWSGRRATELLPALVDAMAPLEPALVEADWRGDGRADPAPGVASAALVVLLTALDPAPLEEGLLPVLPQLDRRHQVVLAAVADPRVDAMAAARGDAGAVYDAAAAERAAGDAARVARPSCAGAASRSSTRARTSCRRALADAYLALKAAGRL